MLNFMTRVELGAVRDERDNRLLFGAPAYRSRGCAGEGDRAGCACFAPQRRVGLDLWKCNRNGTAAWRVLVFGTIGPGATGQRIPYVTPAVRVLRDVKGARRARVLLVWPRKMQRTTDVLCGSDARFEAVNVRFNSMPVSRLETSGTQG